MATSMHVDGPQGLSSKRAPLFVRLARGKIKTSGTTVSTSKNAFAASNSGGRRKVKFVRMRTKSSKPETTHRALTHEAIALNGIQTAKTTTKGAIKVEPKFIKPPILPIKAELSQIKVN